MAKSVVKNESKQQGRKRAGSSMLSSSKSVDHCSNEVEDDVKLDMKDEQRQQRNRHRKLNHVVRTSNMQRPVQRESSAMPGSASMAPGAHEAEMAFFFGMEHQRANDLEIALMSMQQKERTKKFSGMFKKE